MQVADIASCLEDWAPPHMAESYDNVGLLVGDPEMKIQGVLINLDMTLPVLEEARIKGLNMVIAHHPIWFSKRNRLLKGDYVSNAILYAAKYDIALYAIHTNLDNLRTGVNKKIADQLGLTNLSILKPLPANPEHGIGMVGELSESLEKEAFLQLVKGRFKSGGIRYADGEVRQIKKVAVCGGSGSFLTKEALAAQVDAFVTSDITYHKFFDNEQKMLLLDIGHYESEQYTSLLINDYLSKFFPNFAIHLSEIYTNPVRYF